MKLKLILPLFILSVWIISCTPTNNPPPTGPDTNNTKGFNVLSKLKGIWNGPVTSTTPLGGFTEWIVDFRPISENQISAKNELDTLNDINMSFFIALHNNEYKVCFRNGGSFNGAKRISYFLCDSVNETASVKYYRFTEINIGPNRAYTEVVFKDNEDSLYIKSYTNVYNTLPAAVLHMTWSAKIQDRTASQPATSLFNFPVKSQTKDFTNSFTAMSESILYDLAGDPYPEADQPHLGISNVSYTYLAGYTPNPSKKVFLIITTQPLISGWSLNMANLKYRSRYVIVSGTNTSFNFNYMHPGSYYLYAIYDNDDNMVANSGDWVSTTNTSFTLNSESSVSPTTQINFTIP